MAQMTSPAETGDDRPHYDHHVVVLPDDIDANNHASNIVYLCWVQEAAVAHWQATVPAEIAGTMGWFVLRHEIDYKKPALLGEKLRVRTWVKNMGGITSERRCIVYRECDNLILAQVCTNWCAVNPATAKPMRIDSRLPILFGVG